MLASPFLFSHPKMTLVPPQFGDFSQLCQGSPLSICALINPSSSANSTAVYPPINFIGILPSCYSRTASIFNTMVFEIGTSFIHFATLIMLMVIISNVRSRYTAIGRKEMMFFFSMLTALTACSLIVDAGISPSGSRLHAVFVSLQVAIGGSCCWSLLFAGMSAFSFWNDGSFLTMCSLYLSSFVLFCCYLLISILTVFPGSKIGSLVIGPDQTTPLFVVYFVVNGLLLSLYILSQFIVCLFTLVINWWAIGALSLSILFYICAQTLLYALSETICRSLNHYVDGLLFSAISNMFAIMMLYKYWDVITFDDDEYIRYTEINEGVVNQDTSKQEV